MATLTKQPESGHEPALNVVNGSFSPGNSGNAGDGMTQITSGPAALAQLMIYEIMKLYGEIMGLEANQRAIEVKAQVDSAKSQAEQISEAGKKFGEALKIAGGITLALAVGGLVASKGWSIYRTKGLTTQANELDKELTPMSMAEKQMKTENFGAEAGDISSMSQGQASPKVNKLMSEFKEGNFENIGDGTNEESAEAFARLKNNTGDFEKLQDRFHNKYDRLTRAKNNTIQSRNTAEQEGTMAQNLFSSAGNFGSQYKQGVGNAQKAEHDANAIGDQINAQLQGANNQELGQAQQQAFTEQNQEIQILEKIHQTNSVRA